LNPHRTGTPNNIRFAKSTVRFGTVRGKIVYKVYNLLALNCFHLSQLLIVWAIRRRSLQANYIMTSSQTNDVSVSYVSCFVINAITVTFVDLFLTGYHSNPDRNFCLATVGLPAFAIAFMIQVRAVLLHVVSHGNF
jgi:hypothetical protein